MSNEHLTWLIGNICVQVVCLFVYLVANQCRLSDTFHSFKWESQKRAIFTFPPFSDFLANVSVRVLVHVCVNHWVSLSAFECVCERERAKCVCVCVCVCDCDCVCESDWVCMCVCGCMTVCLSLPSLLHPT